MPASPLQRAPPCHLARTRWAATRCGQAGAILALALFVGCDDASRTGDPPTPPASAPAAAPAPTAGGSAAPGPVVGAITAADLPAVTSSASRSRPVQNPAAPDPARYPEAYSPQLAPPPWDAAAYAQDKAGYLGMAVPGRCYQTAPPAATTPALEPVGGTGFSVRTGGTVSLQARSEPGQPVSFTSFGLGVFPANGLTAISVETGADGIARAEFQASEGTVGSCKIVAGSPVRANTLSFLVTVSE